MCLCSRALIHRVTIPKQLRIHYSMPVPSERPRLASIVLLVIPRVSRRERKRGKGDVLCSVSLRLGGGGARPMGLELDAADRNIFEICNATHEKGLPNQRLLRQVRQITKTCTNYRRGEKRTGKCPGVPQQHEWGGGAKTRMEREARRNWRKGRRGRKEKKEGRAR